MEKDTVNELVINRLKKERKEWRADHPFGFVAKPMTNRDGTQNLLKWDCQIPGPKDCPWFGGVYHLVMDFSHDYPVRPPKCAFSPVLPHPNIYPSGTVCLSILNDEQDWKPSHTVKFILESIQKLLKNEPNTQSPAQQEPLNLYKNNKDEYIRNVKLFAQRSRKGEPPIVQSKQLSAKGSTSSKGNAKIANKFKQTSQKDTNISMISTKPKSQNAQIIE